MRVFDCVKDLLGNVSSLKMKRNSIMGSSTSVYRMFKFKAGGSVLPPQVCYDALIVV